MTLGFLLALVVALPAAADTLLVLPFENVARNGDVEWLGESFAEGLTPRLAGAGHGLVPREERRAGLERLGLPPNGPLTRASMIRLAEEVDADWVVFGSFRVEDSRLRVAARLLDVRRLVLSDTLDEEGPFDQLLSLQGRLAWRLLRALDPTFPLSLDAFLAGLPRMRVSAFESYVRGLLAPSRDQQRRYFLQAIRLEPEFPAPAFQLGRLYFDEQDYANATAWLEKVADESRFALDARFHLALCRFFAGDPARARETLEPVAERLPVRAVWNNLGVFASRQGAAPAAGYFARALQDDPTDPDVYFNLGLHHLRRQDWNPAAEALAQSLELAPGDPEALFLRAQALEPMGRREEARQARQQALGDNPALALSLERRQGDLDRLQQNFNARLVLLDRSRQQAAETRSARLQHVAVHLERGENLLVRGETEAARVEFTEAILLDPESHRAHLLLAEVYRREDRLPEAISELRASLWSQDTVPARLRLAEIYLLQNRIEEAEEQVRAALALDPANAEAQALAARIRGREAAPASRGNGAKP